MRSLEIKLYRILRYSVRVFRLRGDVFTHRDLTRAVNGDRRREDKGPHLVFHALVDDVHRTHDVVGIIKRPDEV